MTVPQLEREQVPRLGVPRRGTAFMCAEQKGYTFNLRDAREPGDTRYVPNPDEIRRHSV